MTKGCVIKGLVFTTIFLAIVFYVVTNKFDDWVIKPAKNYIYDSNFDDVKKQFELVKDSEYKDSLIAVLQDYAKTFGEKKNFNLQEISNIAEEFADVISDSIVSKDDFKRIQKIILEDKLNERSEKE